MGVLHLDVLTWIMCWFCYKIPKPVFLPIKSAKTFVHSSPRTALAFRKLKSAVFMEMSNSTSDCFRFSSHRLYFWFSIPPLLCSSLSAQHLPFKSLSFFLSLCNFQWENDNHLTVGRLHNSMCPCFSIIWKYDHDPFIFFFLRCLNFTKKNC